jgi:hypothetical protein
MQLLLSASVTTVLLGVSAWPALPTPRLSAESEAFRKQKLAKTLVMESPMHPAERLPAYTKYDFSSLWREVDSDAVYGFIGPDYQRLQIKLLTIKKSASDPTLYAVTGKTRVLGLVRAFSGTMRLEHIREALNRQLPPPEVGGFNTKVTASGVAVGHYVFFEDSTLAKTGVFSGVVATYWYTDDRRRLHYDSIEGYSDGFTNNQFVGTWTSYNKKQPLRCNWGDFRIPNAGNFDIGAGEFSPDPKHYAKGWQNFATVWSSTASEQQHEQARRRETQAWWK